MHRRKLRSLTSTCESVFLSSAFSDGHYMGKSFSFSLALGLRFFTVTFFLYDKIFPVEFRFGEKKKR